MFVYAINFEDVVLEFLSNTMSHIIFISVLEKLKFLNKNGVGVGFSTMNFKGIKPPPYPYFYNDTVLCGQPNLRRLERVLIALRLLW